jgi:hypothetical protein
VTVLFPAQITANLVMMARQGKGELSALLVEGPRDSRFFKRVVSHKKCSVFPAGNRKLAQEALRILENQRELGVLAIIDGDSDHIAGTSIATPNLLVTPTRDVEGIVLCTDALKHLLIEFDLPEDSFGADPGMAALIAMAPLGFLRYVIVKRGWHVKTAQLDYLAFIDPATLTCNVGALCTHLQSLTITSGVTDADYEAELPRLSSLGLDPSKVARGHDVTEMLASALKANLRKKRKEGAQIDGSLVESYLRMAYPTEKFPECALAREIRDWESRNEPYGVLP